MKKILLTVSLIIAQHYSLVHAQTNKTTIIPGAERMEVYLPLLKGKSVAVYANQTSMVKIKICTAELKSFSTTLQDEKNNGII